MEMFESLHIRLLFPALYMNTLPLHSRQPLYGKLIMVSQRCPCSNLSVQLLSRVQLFATPWIAARQASLSITNSWSSLKLMSIESVTPSSHLILCRPLLLLPPIPPNIRVFSNESTLCMRWPKYWSFSFSIFSIFRACGYVTLHAQGCRYNCWSDDPAIGLFWMRKEEEAESEREVKSLRCWLWRWRKKPQIEKRQWPLETRKCKKSFSPPPEPPERNTALQTPQLYPSESHLGLWTTRNCCYSSNGKHSLDFSASGSLLRCCHFWSPHCVALSWSFTRLFTYTSLFVFTEAYRMVIPALLTLSMALS